jgi:hypothetical protein
MKSRLTLFRQREEQMFTRLMNDRTLLRSRMAQMRRLLPLLTWCALGTTLIALGSALLQMFVLHKPSEFTWLMWFAAALNWFNLSRTHSSYDLLRTVDHLLRREDEMTGY